MTGNGYLDRSAVGSAGAVKSLMLLAWSSKAALTIAPLQDLPNLGYEARMNVPGRSDGNWRWRASADMLSLSALAGLRELTENSDRAVSAKVTVGT